MKIMWYKGKKKSVKIKSKALLLIMGVWIWVRVGFFVFFCFFKNAEKIIIMTDNNNLNQETKRVDLRPFQLREATV